VNQIARYRTTGAPRVLRRAVAVAAVMALSATLGGCLTSTQPLFAESTAVAAFGDGGRYVAYEKADGRYKRDENIELRRTDHGYDYVNEKGSVMPVTFHPLGNGLFVVQAKTESGGYGYARVRIRGTTGFVQVPECDKQDMKKLAPLGVEAHQHDCSLDRVHDAGKLFSIVDFGRTTGKLVPQ
jgi:hypothetical protein